MVNLVACLWILFDVAICLRTGYMTAPFPRAQWWAWLVGGGALAGFAFVAQYLESKANDRKMERLRDQLTRQEGISTGGFSALGLIGNAQLALLGRIADAKVAAEPGAIVTAAVAKIETLSTELTTVKKELDRAASREWQKSTDQQMSQLISALSALGSHSVKLAAHPNTDCGELVYDLDFAFKKAGWECEVLHGTISATLTRGIYLSGKADSRVAFDVCGILSEILGYAAVGLQDRQSTDFIDLNIVIGPKHPAYDASRSTLE